ncbi:MAG: hypothetical protein JW860_07140, partial [Sedimentisphaerales bacterium]|nr:hypothetical protein [Sedimentisphaerales bacterium]
EADANRDWFLAQGVPVGSIAQWISGNIGYSPGWALGEIKFVTADLIQDAYLSGQLEPDDILLTNGIPAEIPDVAGIITLAPTTPNSHVVILAQTYGVPMVYLAVQDDIDTAQSMIGFNTLLCVEESAGYCTVEFTDVDAVMTQQQIENLLALKAPNPLDYPPMATYGAYSADPNNLVPADIKYFGGKAANYGMLTRSIPDRAPVPTAFSFDLWNEFLDQTVSSGKTLRQEINSILQGYSWPPDDMTALSNDLEYIREDLFKDTDATIFSPQLQNAILNTLQDPCYGFDMNSNIRFRSSTNIEDANEFVGAGLYDSYSGCLADDLDGDGSGPCICDPTESKERGVFRAIRKVYASFYNDNAFLERLKYGVDPNEVGMAILVHHSFPDEFELANGVATLEKSSSGPEKSIQLVTQLGATSVANPTDGSIPEEVQAYVDGSGVITLTFVSGSNLVVLGEKVMDWQDDYLELAQALVDASDEFENQTGKNDYIIDFEYKNLEPGGAALPAGGICVKQIRELPQPDPADLECPTLDPPIPTSCPSSCFPYPVMGDQLRSLTDDGVSIMTIYHLEICPPGWICKTLAFEAWQETIITGLTSEPIYLYSCDSQCYTAGWHNWCENFYFEPMFEPGISPCIIEQLQILNIKGIEMYNITYCGTPGIRYHTFDGQVIDTPYRLGDFEPDGDIDLTDLLFIADHWLAADCDLCGGANLNCDNKVNLQDFAELARHWLYGTP